MRFCLITRFHRRHQNSSFVLRLLAEAHALGHSFDLINPEEVSFAYDHNQFPLRYRGGEFPHYDLIHYALRWDDDHTWEVIDTLRGWGRKVLPSSRVPMGDSITMARLFARKNILTPRTWVFGRVDELLACMGEVTYPCIFRVREGVKGRKMLMVTHSGEAIDQAGAISRGGQPFLVQEVPDPQGRDIRVMVIGGEVVCAVERVAPEGFVRPREDRNASAVPVELTAQETQVAVAAAAVYHAPYAAVSLLRPTSGSERMVLEVTRAPALAEMEAATGVNIARKMVEYCTDVAQKHA
jgi:ribosomal protein S6--L-glutamate ligase